MKKYVFRLEKLLELRLSREEECIRRFKAAQVDKLEKEQQILELKKKYKNSLSKRNYGNTAYRKILENYLKSLEGNISDKKVELLNCEKVLEDNREELRKKRIDRKTVEILKENGKRAFLKEQDRIEQINNDEFALYGHIRRSEGRWKIDGIKSNKLFKGNNINK